MFPQEFPKAALSTLIGLAKSEKPNVDVIALAVYDLSGYALGQYFGDVKYPIGLDIGKIFAILSTPEYAKAKEAVLKYYQLVGDGQSKFQTIFQLLLQYGPEILKLVLAVIAMFGGAA